MENEEVKHLDYLGLSLYDLNIKEWATTKDEEIKINQVNGKSNSKTILVTPGSTTPATYYTASEAEAYNIEHGLQEGDPDYKHEGDLKTPASTTNTNIEVNIDNSTIVLDGTSGQLKVSSTALTKYIGDKDGENKYAINVSPTADSNNNKTISLDINSESNAIEKTTSGVKVKLGINKFNNPSIFGDNVREAYALSANDVIITGSNNEQVIKIYKDSALLDMKLLHAIPATYYTAEEAAEYNTEHGLSPGDPNYKSEGDLKTSAIKPVYTKLNGWIDIEASLRTEENLALCFAYENVNGEIVVEAIQVGSFLRETEFKEGLQVVDGEVSVKLSSEKVRIAATPEGVTPGSELDTGLVEVATLNLSNGVQINHIQDAINYAINTFVPDTYTKEELDESEEVIARALNDLNTRVDNKADASVFGASGENHSTGLVPDPGDVAGTTKFLREDGTWQEVITDNSDVEKVISAALNDLDIRILKNKVNNGTLTILKNGSTVASFDANAMNNVTANISVPTNTSELVNDSKLADDIEMKVVSAALNDLDIRINNLDIPEISTNIDADKVSDTKTASPKAVYDEIYPAVQSSQPQGGMLPNKLYNLGTLTGNVTFTLAAGTSGIVNHYYWTFDIGSTAPTITWPSGITWSTGSAPTIATNKHYEISVLNNIAIYMEVW